MKNPNLWHKIERFSFDEPDADFCFSDRLSRENGWSKRFANQVIDEYRRFSYLAMVCEHEVTPSDEVDQAWHMHLLYTRQYWGGWCETLGSPLHHGPTKGGKKEDSRYLENYLNTLQSYQTEFSKEPPKSIWPNPDIRFTPMGQIIRINRADTLIVSKDVLATASRSFLLLAALIGTAYGTFTSAFAQSSSQQTEGLTMIGWMGITILCAIVIGGVWFLLFGHKSNKGKKKGCSSGGGTVSGGGCGSPGNKKSGGEVGSGCGGSGCGGGGGGCGGGG